MATSIADAPSREDTDYRPSLKEMVLLETPTAIKISPGGRRVAVAVRTTNWKENRYETVCHVHDLVAGTHTPINRTGSVSQFEWVDDETLAVLKKPEGEDAKAQIVLFEGLTGEGWVLTDQKTGVEWFAPFAGGFVYRARHPERDEKKARTDRFGKYVHVEQEESPSALYYVDLEALRAYEARVKAATEDEAKGLVRPVVELSLLLEERLAIREVFPSPTGDAVYFTTWQREDLVYYRETGAYCIRLDPRAAVAEHVRREEAKEEASEGEAHGGEAEEDLSWIGRIDRLPIPRAAFLAGIAPDGRRLAVLYQGRDDKMYTQYDLWLIGTEQALAVPDAAAFLAAMEKASGAIDQELLAVEWVAAGLYVTYPEGTRVRAARLDEDGRATTIDLGDRFPLPLSECLDVSDAGQIAFVGADAHSVAEAYVAEPGEDAVRRLTDFGQAVAGWELGSVETIRWTSRDGTEIEGVLRKPAGFDPSRRYPLVFVVHGGPSWFSPEVLMGGEERGYYPTVQFAHKDILVLKPNYRGSIGRGQAFTELNVNNLGVGDLWDLESAIDHLAGLGWVDVERVGCMGWSQGGYISAFAGLHSTAFRAVSVGAGIADWYTYHISNDIPDFTVDYLSGSPFRDRARYIKTAPISKLAEARTPVLIQHGTADQRVPVSNAMELYRGLKEMGVPVELFIYPGMAHPITKPRENHAVMHQNLAWFSHYLLGEELELA